MNQATHNKIVSFIWGIADDVLRDLFKRGKYPDVILPMCVIRRMDAVLETTKQAVLETKNMLDQAHFTEQRAALCEAAGQAFYNTSRFTLRDLKSRGSRQQLFADFEDYLNGFSPNVQDILENFKFRNQLSTLSKNDAIGTLINRFLDPDIDLSPAGIDNHSMGTVFEELVRKFNEENNEEAGEHWTPRDAVRLMANLVFLPIEAQIKSGTYLLYDCACGTGGMLTVGEETLKAIGTRRAQRVECLLYGQEINPETYAVCKADMLLKGEGESAEHIVGGAEWSTLSHDAFPAQEFDFMLANPPSGKSWKKDLEEMHGKDGMTDPRFKVMHNGEELSLVTRSVETFDNNGNYLTEFASYSQLSAVGFSAIPFGISYITGIAVDSMGHVYLSNGNNSSLVKFDTNGSYLTQFGSPGSGPGQIGAAGGAAVDSNGNVFVSDPVNSRVEEFSPLNVRLNIPRFDASHGLVPSVYVKATNGQSIIVTGHWIDQTGGNALIGNDANPPGMKIPLDRQWRKLADFSDPVVGGNQIIGNHTLTFVVDTPPSPDGTEGVPINTTSPEQIAIAGFVPSKNGWLFNNGDPKCTTHKSRFVFGSNHGIPDEVVSEDGFCEGHVENKRDHYDSILDTHAPPWPTSNTQTKLIYDLLKYYQEAGNAW